MEILIDEQEMAKRLGVSVFFLQCDRARSGRHLVPVVRIGTLVRYRPESVADAMAALETGGASTNRQKARRSA